MGSLFSKDFCFDRGAVSQHQYDEEYMAASTSTTVVNPQNMSTNEEILLQLENMKHRMTLLETSVGDLEHTVNITRTPGAAGTTKPRLPLRRSRSIRRTTHQRSNRRDVPRTNS